MSLPTPAAYAGVHRVHVFCRHCDRVAELDLPALIAAGHGHTPLIHLPLRCVACGQAGHTVSVSGRSYGLDARVSTKPI